LVNLTYQWFVENTPVPEATNSLFMILTAAAVANLRNYICRITAGICGTIPSDVAALIENQEPTIVIQSGGNILCIVNPLVLNVTAKRTNLTYQ
jgi:hypothetical protein